MANISENHLEFPECMPAFLMGVFMLGIAEVVFVVYICMGMLHSGHVRRDRSIPSLGIESVPSSLKFNMEVSL